jgi:hypothetical protein
MARGYVYRKPVKRSQYSNFRRYMFISIVLIILLGAAGYFIYSGLHTPATSPTSAVQNTEISDTQKTYTNNYFRFKDTPSWVIDKNNTTASKIVYHKFNKNVLEAEMIVYINQDPIPLYTAVPRALPVRVVNSNSFQTTQVSNPCVSQYAKSEPHRVKEVSISGASMLCDPDSPQYFVIISEIGGDYHLNLKTAAGKPIEFVITYKDDIDTNTPTSILNIAGSFQTR